MSRTTNRTSVGFILDLGQVLNIHYIFLVNTFDGKFGGRNRGTKGFKVYVGESPQGPWNQVLQEELPDSRQMETVFPEIFQIQQTNGSYVKFELLSYWGIGGGLQYFTVIDYDPYKSPYKDGKECKTTHGKKCVFPFTFKGVTYTDCTKRSNYGVFWCSTKTDREGNYLPNYWGNCDIETCLGTYNILFLISA